jgi:ABC-type multidrug transport system fused ATPase/permease subunit
MSQSYVAISRTQTLLLLEECSKSEAITQSADDASTAAAAADGGDKVEVKISGDAGVEMVSVGVSAVDGEREAIISEMKRNGIALRMDHFCATWQPDQTLTHNQHQEQHQIHAQSDDENSVAVPSPALVLNDINLSVSTGELIVIVGPVGASKSSVLMALLGELAPLTNGRGGRLDKIGAYAYCSQEPWIMSTTVSYE